MHLLAASLGFIVFMAQVWTMTVPGLAYADANETVSEGYLGGMPHPNATDEPDIFVSLTPLWNENETAKDFVPTVNLTNVGNETGEYEKSPEPSSPSSHGGTFPPFYGKVSEKFQVAIHGYFSIVSTLMMKIGYAMVEAGSSISILLTQLQWYTQWVCANPKALNCNRPLCERHWCVLVKRTRFATILIFPLSCTVPIVRCFMKIILLLVSHHIA